MVALALWSALVFWNKEAGREGVSDHLLGQWETYSSISTQPWVSTEAPCLQMWDRGLLFGNVSCLWGEVRYQLGPQSCSEALVHWCPLEWKVRWNKSPGDIKYVFTDSRV